VCRWVKKLYQNLASRELQFARTNSELRRAWPALPLHRLLSSGRIQTVALRANFGLRCESYLQKNQIETMATPNSWPTRVLKWAVFVSSDINRNVSGPLSAIVSSNSRRALAMRQFSAANLAIKHVKIDNHARNGRRVKEAGPVNE